MEPKIIDKVLSKTASLDEAHKVAAWAATPEGQAYVSERFDKESFMLNEKNIATWLDHEIASEQMKLRFISQLKMRVRTFRFKLVAAALVPFILLASTLTFVVNRTGILSKKELCEIIVPYGEQKYIILQDGTIVQLNSGSHLQYPKSFGLFSRKVKLSGEGYFSVEKEKGRPFMIDLEDMTVVVTGTKFNVKAYPDDTMITVALEEGSVKINDQKNNEYQLKVGQNSTYDRQTSIYTVSNTHDMSQHTAWRTKSLNFYRTKLEDILTTLERQYELQFTVTDSSILKYKFSISTSRVNAVDILADLEKVSKIRFTQTDKHNYEVTSLN